MNIEVNIPVVALYKRTTIQETRNAPEDERFFAEDERFFPSKNHSHPIYLKAAVEEL